MRKLSLKELNRLSVSAYKATEKTPIVVVLDNIRSGMNVGSIFRTSDAFALEGIYLCGITVQPPHKEITKTAIGASASVTWTYKKSVVECVQHLKNEGYKMLGVEQTDSSVLLQNIEISTKNKYAIVVGNEVNGISNEILPLLDMCIEIPQFGTKHSLNVSVCTGMVIWDLVKKIKL